MEPVIITRDNNPCNTFFVSVVSLEDHFTRSDGYVQVSIQLSNVYTIL